MLVTYDEYVRLCMSDEIGSSEWERWELKARLEVAAATYGRIYDLDLLPSEIKLCICEVAERLYNRNKLLSAYGAPVASVSNDGVSVNYAGANELTEAGFRAELMDVIKKHLGDTGLLYRGCCT